MAKRELVMLAHTYNQNKHGTSGWFWSEKLDGLRAYWDGGITRGLLIKDVPFANREKDYRLLNPNYEATGLWTRNAKVIRAPEWFLNCLPNCPLDGELWAGHNNFQLTMSIARDIYIDENKWQHIKYMIFDQPRYSAIFSDGDIDVLVGTSRWKNRFSGIVNWASERALKVGIDYLSNGCNFEEVYIALRKKEDIFCNEYIQLLKQERMPYGTDLAKRFLQEKLEELSIVGAEGIMLRKPESCWSPNRSYNLLKAKKWSDAEAKVIGYVWGRETELGSKLLGKMGAMIVDWNGKIFEISGFTDNEREMKFLNGTSAAEFGAANPGKRVDIGKGIINPTFPIGTLITFRYNDLSTGGCPKVARYWRKAI